ncbi:hypothetical protein D3C72_2552280 [compost metagenome]
MQKHIAIEQSATDDLEALAAHAAHVGLAGILDRVRTGRRVVISGWRHGESCYHGQGDHVVEIRPRTGR